MTVTTYHFGRILVFSACLNAVAMNAVAKAPSTDAGWDDPERPWSVGIGLGEVPIMAGSFKLDLTAERRLTETLRLATSVQMPDSIHRDAGSYNAAGIGLQGLHGSSERTGIRALLTVRRSLGRSGLFVSTGLVYNAEDVETASFDTRSRPIGAGTYGGPLDVVITRRAGVRPAIGLGYRRSVGRRLQLDIEWTFDVFTGVTEPAIELRGVDLDAADRRVLASAIAESYRGNFHNRYHVFHFGVRWLLP